MALIIYSDGGSRGNPGISAFAIVVCRNGKIIHEHAEFIGVVTNNEAEYRGLIYAIGYALDSRDDDVEFVMDSKLVIEQMNGNFKVRSEKLAPLHRDAKALSSAIRNAKFTHVLRSDKMITVADSLLNRKMDEFSKTG